MKVVERISEERLCRMARVNEIQFDIMPERGTIDTVFTSRMQ